jgi:peptidoglycan/LPS O-acetylase OafA/YrhL
VRARDRRRANNFDLLRLLAAIAVLVSHSFALSVHREPVIGGYTLGTVAVYVFFGISGFLITQSWVVAPIPRVFVVKRLLRIYPAFFVVLVAGVFVLGPAMTTLPLTHYFSSGDTYRYLYENLSMWKSSYLLPGVFGPPKGSPIPMYINGSIWTIPNEIRAYLVVLILGCMGIYRSRRLALVVVVAVVVVSTLFQGDLLGPPDLLRMFVLGSLLYLFSDRVPLSWVAATTLVVGWLLLQRVSPQDIEWQYLGTIAIAYAAITIAHRTPEAWRRLTRHGDFSYGIYLWAWPVQMTVLTLFFPLTSFETIIITLPVTAVLGVCSWLLVERRALTLKPRPTAPLPD